MQVDRVAMVSAKLAGDNMDVAYTRGRSGTESTTMTLQTHLPWFGTADRTSGVIHGVNLFV